MKYRKWIDGFDISFGHGSADYWDCKAEGVAQAVISRLKLGLEEWFLDLEQGTPFNEIVGKNTESIRDIVIRERILETQGVTAITSYESKYNGETRSLTVFANIDTLFGETSLQFQLEE